ncbi:MAG: ATP-binding protein [SAR202 cluster bacterium]|nr:hypothetical protein [Chloroflexota bacterium]MQG22471.1 ATP-binding protein [SAR202 cluster bacterium]|tara:strand:+ start:1782 stop:3431 length:1650 start_codon:yes stop_codon:yes gene_type:complete
MTQSNIESNIGFIIGGSYSEGLKVKLSNNIPVESISDGLFVVIEGASKDFLAVVKDIVLEATDPKFQSLLLDDNHTFLNQTLSGTVLYTTLIIKPVLIFGDLNPYFPNYEVGSENSNQNSKNIPGYFSIVRKATKDDMDRIFENQSQANFPIGEFINMDESNISIAFNIDKMTSRNTGVFGKTGSGKTFLTRILLSGIIKSDFSSNLIFDMHNDYGWSGTTEGQTEVKGLKQLFPSNVFVHSLDKNTRNSNNSPDALIKIKYSDIEPEDIALLQRTLDLNEKSIEASYALKARFGNDWLGEFMNGDIEDLAAKTGSHAGTLEALKRRLSRLTRYTFIDNNLNKNNSDDFASDIITQLLQGYNVVLNFGRFASDRTAYILIANMLSRRIYNEYKKKMENALANSNPSDRPRNLVITIEEAHLFLDSSVANQTIFGNIAREMRKYNVTLLVVDQRPSQIDDDVMSQIGTKIACSLDSDKDVDAVLSGDSQARELRGVLSKLEPNGQALIISHALPIPVPIKTRRYNEDFYQSMAPQKTQKQIDQDKKNLGL